MPHRIPNANPPGLRPHKRLYLTLEGINALCAGLYYNFVFFYFEQEFAFGDRDNLFASAAGGFLYIFTAWQAGRLAQRRGYLNTLRFGIVIIMAGLTLGAAFQTDRFLPNLPALQISVLLVWTLGISITWPSLEALVSDRESAANLPRMVGIYNVTWAAGWAVAYFVGGAMLEHLGRVSIFLAPLVLHGLQLLLIRFLHSPACKGTATASQPDHAAPEPSTTPAHPRAALFRQLSWLANPFAYMAMSALVPVIPGLAQRHDLSPTAAGIFCSTWFFARLGAFFLLWHWPGWHYQLRWLLGAFALLITSYALILLSPTLWPIFVGQILFGAACGLLYYSSLYYSMDAGDAKGEHGGIHEAVIGAGIFAGPAIGGLALLLFPDTPNVDVWAVSLALSAGLVAAILLCRRPPASSHPNPSTQ